MRQKVLQKIFLTLSLACIASFQVSAVALNEMTFITESNASYNYVREGKLQGAAVELLLQATERAGSPIRREDILVLPWARGLQSAIDGPNTVLFSTIRTPMRETKFQWVGPIAIESDVLIALKKRKINISGPDDMKKFITGAVRGDVGEEILIENNVPLPSMVLLSHSKSMGEMLNLGRIDLWIFGEDGWRDAIKTTDLDTDDFEVVYRFPAKNYYFAFSLDVNKDLVKSFQLHVEQVLSLNDKMF